MTLDDLRNSLTWSDDYTARGRVFLPLFGHEVPLEVITADTVRDVTPALHAALVDLLAVGPEAYDRVTGMVGEHCKSCCANSLYDPVPEGQDTTVANHRLFGLNPDGSAPADWFRAEWLRCVYLVEDFDEAPPDASLDFRVAWDDHGVHIHLEDGRLIEFNP